MQFTIAVAAPASKAYDVMLGISDKSTYEKWTAQFNPTSSYYGGWSKGSKILFVGTDENGEKGGMVAAIQENIPNEFVSIQHKGLLKGDQEIIEGPEVEKWAGGFENYSFRTNDGGCTIIVDLDTTEDFAEYMSENYPKALERLKALCEE